jgi:hypothetical protein
MIGRPARLDPDQARRQRRKERFNFRSPQRLADLDAPFGINPVNLKNVLGDIEPDHGNVHLDGSLGLEMLTPQSWHNRCRSGAIHPSRTRAKRAPPPAVARRAILEFEFLSRIIASKQSMKAWRWDQR